MKPNINITQRAVAERVTSSPAKRAIVYIDGVQFCSEKPLSETEAIEINTAIERLVEAVKP